MDLKETMMSLKNWAVIGASSKPEKISYKIYKSLRENDYQVYPVNKNYDKIDQDKVYKSILDIEASIDVVDMLVNPKIGMEVLDQIRDKGVEYIWFQPGSFDEELLKKADQLGFKYLYDECIYRELI